MKLARHTCLLTGAAGGLGAHLAKVFWEAGANLILAARSQEALLGVVGSLSHRPEQRVVTLSADLIDPLAPDRIIAEAKQMSNRLDVLVNNAAIQGPIGPLWENDWQAWHATLQVSLLAPVALCRLCVPWMAQHGCGKIINLSGGGGTSPRPNFSAYATAKAGLIRFSETLAEETRHLGIHVNCVAPGAMSTSLLAAVLKAGPGMAGQREYEQALKVCESGGANPERVASLCVFLASADSDGITGKLISAVWDPYESFSEHLEDLQKTDIYTLRRIVPKDRGFDWGER
jgi:3-oxoacyl-[acyl-carrier protein] reductase